MKRRNIHANLEHSWKKLSFLVNSGNEEKQVFTERKDYRGENLWLD